MYRATANQSTFERRAGLSRVALLALQVGVIGLLGACDDEELTADSSLGATLGGAGATGGGPGGATAGSTGGGPGATTGGAPDGGGTGSTGGGIPTGSDAGSPGGGVDAGSTGGMDASSSGGDAGSDGATGSADAGADGANGSADGGDAGSDGGPPVGPIVLPDPSEPGPHGSEVEENVGKGFENPIDANDQPGNNQYCLDFALSFGQDEQESMEFAAIPPNMNMALYTLFRPQTFEAGKKYPILTWGNGTCALPQGYGNLLKHVASHGFFVIAANTRFTGDGSAQLKGIDVMKALNQDPTSAAYNRVDVEKVGAFGHSQGALSTGVASADARVDASILLNGAGGLDAKGPAYFLTGEADLAPFASELSYSLTSAPGAASINFKNSDHITLITEPARVWPSVTAWFRYHLNGDAAGKAYFVGASCKLCNKPNEWAYEQRGLQ